MDVAGPRWASPATAGRSGAAMLHTASLTCHCRCRRLHGQPAMPGAATCVGMRRNSEQVHFGWHTCRYISFVCTVRLNFSQLRLEEDTRLHLRAQGAQATACVNKPTCFGHGASTQRKIHQEWVISKVFKVKVVMIHDADAQSNIGLWFTASSDTLSRRHDPKVTLDKRIRDWLLGKPTGAEGIAFAIVRHSLKSCQVLDTMSAILLQCLARYLCRN